MNLNFKDKTVLITAGSKGIGLELANEFLKLEANVCICSRNKVNLKNAIKKISKNTEIKRLLVLQHDISNLKKQSYLIKKIEKKFKTTIDILINNSGGPPPEKIENLNLKDWNKTINTNLLSAITITKEVLRGMKKNRWGRIINMTSTTAKEPAKNMVLSNVSRAALASYSKTLSLEIADYGITVNTILTGGCLTDRLVSLIKKNTSKGKNFKKNLRQIISQTPMKKIAEPKEFIQLIIFLASDNSSYINGTAFNIDGGTSKTVF